MGIRFLKLSGMADPPQHERRRSDRKLVRASLTVSTSEGETAPAEINDVSPMGCNLKADADWLRMGKFVTVAMGDSLTVTGIVRWSRDRVHGIEFLRPLPGAIVEELEVLFG